MKRVLAIIVSLLFFVVLYLVCWPIPVQTVAWHAPHAPGYIGDHAPNERLAKLQMISLKNEDGPEHVAIGKDGKLYVAVASGKIMRMNPDGSQQEVFVNTGGRVLGFDFDKSGRLIAADAFKGLLSVEPNRKISVLVDNLSDKPIYYANSVVVAKSGKIYFSDSSTRFPAALWGGTFEASVLDIMEQSATGRVLEYNPVTNTTRIVACGFSFANGLALSRDEQNLFVVETGRYRIWKIATTANELNVKNNSSLAYVLLDNLPGYPDNLMRGLNGRIWVGLAKPRSKVIDKMADKPFLRKVTLRLPRVFWPVPKPYGHVFAFREDGKIVADLQDPTGAYPETTGITEISTRMYVQSLHAKGLGWLKH